MKSEHKFIEQRKLLRIVCYKAEKFNKSISEVCHFKKTELDETCKFCVYFKIVDESRKLRDALHEIELDPSKPVTLSLGELPRPELEELKNL